MPDLNPEALEAAALALSGNPRTWELAPDLWKWKCRKEAEAAVRAYRAADEGAVDPRLGGITSEGLDLYEHRLDELGVPREEYAAQAGGVVRYTFWGRLDEALEGLAADKGAERDLLQEVARQAAVIDELQARNGELSATVARLRQRVEEYKEDGERLRRVSTERPGRKVTVELTAQELATLLWHLRTIDHAYGHEHSYLGAGDTAERKLEAASRRLDGEVRVRP